MLKSLIKSMRLRQWTKNIFVLAAIVFDKKLFNLHWLLISLAGFVCFCFLSSSVYIFNDIMDIKADRNHPEKKNRPIASGQLSIPVALIAAIILAVGSLTSSYFFSLGFGIFASIYLIINLLYSKWLKHIPLLDVMIVASGFVLRVAAGVALIKVDRFSPWLYVVTTLLALYLGFGKRRAELALLTKDASSHRQVLDGYSIPLLDQLITIVSGMTIIAYSLYTFQAQNTNGNYYTMLTIPFVVFGIFRYLYLIQVKNAGGAPEELLLSDRQLQITVLLYGIAVLVVFYLLPRILSAPIS
jgi:4-hydroxybenzoate polyprenyltransferase